MGDDRVIITGIASLAEACPGQISFYADPRFKDLLQSTKASAILTAQPLAGSQGSQVIVRNPVLAYARAAVLFAPPPRVVGVSEKQKKYQGLWS